MASLQAARRAVRISRTLAQLKADAIEKDDAKPRDLLGCADAFHAFEGAALPKANRWLALGRVFIA